MSISHHCDGEETSRRHETEQQQSQDTLFLQTERKPYSIAAKTETIDCYQASACNATQLNFPYQNAVCLLFVFSPYVLCTGASTFFISLKKTDYL